MTILVVRIDAGDAFVPVVIEELLKKFPVTVMHHIDGTEKQLAKVSPYFDTKHLPKGGTQ